MAAIFSFHFFKHLETRQSLVIETFNEAIVLILVYIVMCFCGDFIDDPDMRNNLGYFYIGVIIFCISIHLLLLLISYFKVIKQALKKRYARK